MKRTSEGKSQSLNFEFWEFVKPSSAGEKRQQSFWQWQGRVTGVCDRSDGERLLLMDTVEIGCCVGLMVDDVAREAPLSARCCFPTP